MPYSNHDQDTRIDRIEIRRANRNGRHKHSSMQYGNQKPWGLPRSRSRWWWWWWPLSGGQKDPPLPFPPRSPPKKPSCKKRENFEPLSNLAIFSTILMLQQFAIDQLAIPNSRTRRGRDDKHTHTRNVDPPHPSLILSFNPYPHRRTNAVCYSIACHMPKQRPCQNRAMGNYLLTNKNLGSNEKKKKKKKKKKRKKSPNSKLPSTNGRPACASCRPRTRLPRVMRVWVVEGRSSLGPWLIS